MGVVDSNMVVEHDSRRKPFLKETDSAVKARPRLWSSVGSTPRHTSIRNIVDIPTIAVGVISSYDDVNSILLA